MDLGRFYGDFELIPVFSGDLRIQVGCFFDSCIRGSGAEPVQGRGR